MSNRSSTSSAKAKNARTMITKKTVKGKGKGKGKATAKGKGKASARAPVIHAGETVALIPKPVDLSYDGAYLEEGNQQAPKLPVADLVPASRIRLSSQTMSGDDHMFPFLFAFHQFEQLPSQDQKLYYMWLQGRHMNLAFVKARLAAAQKAQPEKYETIYTMEADLITEAGAGGQKVAAPSNVNLKLASEHLLRLMFNGFPDYTQPKRYKTNIAGDPVWVRLIQEERKMLAFLIDSVKKMEMERDGKKEEKKVAPAHYLDGWKTADSEAQLSSRILALLNFLQVQFKVALSHRKIQEFYNAILPVVYEEAKGHPIAQAVKAKERKEKLAAKKRLSDEDLVENKNVDAIINDSYMYYPLKYYIVSYLQARPALADPAVSTAPKQVIVAVDK